MMYKSIDKRYLYTTMLCELIDKYVVEKLLCSGGVKWVLEIYMGRMRTIMKWNIVTAMLLLALK